MGSNEKNLPLAETCQHQTITTMDFKTVKDTEQAKYKHENPASKQRRFLNKYLADNEQKFMDAMDDIYEHDKKGFAKLYIEMQKAILPKEQAGNITIGFSKDMENLMTLGRAATDPKVLEAHPVEDAEFQDMNRGIAEMENSEKKESLPLPPLP